MQETKEEFDELEDSGKLVLKEQETASEPYPAKPWPEEQEGKNKTFSFILSIVLFVAFYYFFVSKDLEIITWLAVIVLIHELGHYFAMKIFHYEDLSIFFIPLLGAVAGGSKEKISQREKAIVLLAGPVPGIIIGVCLFLIGTRYEHYQLLRLSYAFVLINVLNLLPVYPLDGGQLVKTLFLGSRQIVTTIFMIASLILLSTYAIINEEWFLLIVPYFLITRMVRERQIHRIRKQLALQQIDYFKHYGELTDADYWQIRAVVLSADHAMAKKVQGDERIVSGNENELINYVKSVLVTRPVKDLSTLGITLFLVLWIASILVPLVLMTRILETISS